MAWAGTVGSAGDDWRAGNHLRSWLLRLYGGLRTRGMARLILDQFITTGDALSQLVGRWIPVWYDGRWHRYTRSANESISGASDWHRQHGRWPWVAWSIDALFALFGDENHCNKAWANDFNRAVKLLRDNGYEVGF